MHRHNTKIMEDVEVCTACGRKVRQDGKDSTNKFIWKEECVPLKTYKKYLDLGHQPKRIEGRWNCGRCDRTGAPLRETRCNRKARVKRGNRKRGAEWSTTSTPSRGKETRMEAMKNQERHKGQNKSSISPPSRDKEKEEEAMNKQERHKGHKRTGAWTDRQGSRL